MWRLCPCRLSAFPSLCDLVSATKPFVEFPLNLVNYLEKLPSKCEFRENVYCESHTLGKGVIESLSISSTLLVPF